jgi:hypothetical protein
MFLVLTLQQQPVAPQPQRLLALLLAFLLLLAALLGC